MAELESTTETAPSTSPGSAVTSTKPAESNNAETPTRDSTQIETAESLEVDHPELRAKATSNPGLPATPNPDCTDAEVRVPENSTAKVETKEGNLERASEKMEPRDEDLVVTQ